jgi:hypothetical protein
VWVGEWVGPWGERGRGESVAGALRRLGAAAKKRREWSGGGEGAVL